MGRYASFLWLAVALPAPPCPAADPAPIRADGPCRTSVTRFRWSGFRT